MITSQQCKPGLRVIWRPFHQGIAPSFGTIANLVGKNMFTVQWDEKEDYGTEYAMGNPSSRIFPA
jgi:hypothetical protein